MSWKIKKHEICFLSSQLLYIFECCCTRLNVSVTTTHLPLYPDGELLLSHWRWKPSEHSKYLFTSNHWAERETQPGAIHRRRTSVRARRGRPRGVPRAGSSERSRHLEGVFSSAFCGNFDNSVDHVVMEKVSLNAYYLFSRLLPITENLPLL